MAIRGRHMSISKIKHFVISFAFVSGLAGSAYCENIYLAPGSSATIESTQVFCSGQQMRSRCTMVRDNDPNGKNYSIKLDDRYLVMDMTLPEALAQLKALNEAGACY
jgi:hypothetical protein